MRAAEPRSPSSKAQARADNQVRSDARRRAFLAFMAEHGLTATSWARAAGMPTANAIYNFLNGHTRSLTQSTLERLARAAGSTVAEIIGESAALSRQAIVIPVSVTAASGQWRAGYEAPGRAKAQFAIPPGIEVDEAVVITDDHANAFYTPGTLVGLQGFGSPGVRPLADGDRVVVHRKNDSGKHEITVRLIEQHADGAKLVFASLNQDHVGQIAIKPWPYNGGWWDAEGMRVQIRGRVIMSTFVDEK